ncbi:MULTISPECIES: glycosyl hydrolase family 28-related protein [unclassified Enterobacter]|uniref:glycosyl hydrolase family 28-related protein n=1 Tax=unclassified Enterobacter TaxID=2608935 RepID=UPI00292ACC60|nr:glycosyl hydrolase family 28-related protein [Enterobacter sp. 23-M-SZ-13]MDV0593217.1 glycosyl hydrolase family 28-related protein [Enterobacter sp. 23-M-SZ-13]
MTTQPTQDAVPSESPRDLKFNAGKFDEVITSFSEWYIDRFGQKHYTIEGLKALFDARMEEWNSLFQEFLESSGYEFLGDYEDGPLTFTSRNQYIRYDGQYWKLNSATDVPFTTTGTDATSWASDVTHFALIDGDTLRQELASSASGNGDALITVKQPYPNTVLRTQHDVNADYVNVKDWGAKGDGVTDDTAAIEAAWLAVTSKGSKYFPQHSTGESILNWASINGPKLYFPAGRYIYRGAGLNLNDTVNQVPFVAIKGESKSSVEIWLDGDMYFVNSAVNPYQIDVSDFKVYGGLGLLKFTSAAQNQVQLSLIENILLTAFRECAIGLSSQDWPNTKMRNLQFYPRSGYQTICIMMSGWCANSEIVGCEFGLAEGTGVYSYGIKLNIAPADAGGYRGPTTPILIADNGTYRRNNVDGSASVWIVPNPSTNDNAGRAVVFRNNKWGAENVNTNTYHVLIADENTGGTWGGNRRHLTSKSTGFVRGLVFDKNNIRFEPNATQPYIASYTPHVQGLVCEDVVDNTLPVLMLEYRGGMTYADFNPQDCDNLISTRYWLAPTATNYVGAPVSQVTNFPATTRVVDEKNYLNMSCGTTFPGESSVTYRNLMTLLNSAAGTVNGATKTVIDNSIGIPSEAASIVFSSNNGRVTYPLQSWDVNRNIWIEVELARGDKNSMASVTIEIVESDTIKYHRRFLNLTTEWRLYRFPISLPAGSTVANLRVVGSGYSASTTTIKVGRVAAYHASEPINTGHARSIGSAWNSQHITLGAYHIWVDGSGVLRIKNGTPTSGTDGTVIGSQT